MDWFSKVEEDDDGLAQATVESETVSAWIQNESGGERWARSDAVQVAEQLHGVDKTDRRAPERRQG